MPSFSSLTIIKSAGLFRIEAFSTRVSKLIFTEGHLQHYGCHQRAVCNCKTVQMLLLLKGILHTNAALVHKCFPFSNCPNWFSFIHFRPDESERRKTRSEWGGGETSGSERSCDRRKISELQHSNNRRQKAFYLLLVWKEFYHEKAT